MDIRASGLDRQGQAERSGNPRGGGAVGIEELRIDQIEGLCGVQSAGERQDGADNCSGIKPAANARNQAKARAQHSHPAALFLGGQAGECAIAWVQRHWPGRQADWIDQQQFSATVPRHGLHLPLDENTEIGLRIARIKRAD